MLDKTPPDVPSGIVIGVELLSTLQTLKLVTITVILVDETGDTDANHQSTHSPPTPPVEEGDQRTVEIEDIGEQGDGITRVERGFVVIVPDTDRGERVTVEITDVQTNVAFAAVVERLHDHG